MAMNPRLLRPTASGFSPRQIASLHLWLDGADPASVTLDANTLVSEWRDKSGNSRHCQQTTAGDRPAYISAAQGGRNALRFGASTTRSLAQSTGQMGISGGSARTLFTVQKEDNPTAAQYPAIILWGAEANYATYAHNVYRASGSVPSVIGADIYNEGKNTVLSVGSASVLASQVDASSKVTVWRNGVSLGTTTNSANTTDTAYRVGRWLTLGVYPSDICEIILYSRALSTDEIQRVEGYLAWKWGSQSRLPAGHPYANARPR